MRFMKKCEICVKNPNDLEEVVDGYLKLIETELENLEKADVNEIAKENAKLFLLGAIKVIKDLKNDKEKTIVQLVNDVIFTTLLRFCALATISLPPKLALAVTMLVHDALTSGAEE